MGNSKDKPEPGVVFDADVHGEIETDSTGKNILIRDPGATVDTSELEILEYSPPGDNDSDKPGEMQKSDDANDFDPYNSGRFDMSDAELAKAREWKTKSRK